MPMQCVSMTIDGSVLKLPPLAIQDDWIIVFNEAIYVIYRRGYKTVMLWFSPLLLPGQMLKSNTI